MPDPSRPIPRRPVIVIFGAAVRPGGEPSGALRGRVVAAVKFGQELSPAPRYLPTGGQGRFGPPEAAVMAALLQRLGVAPEAITQEPTGRNTLRSALAVARVIRSGPDPVPVYVATSAYHMPRCVLLLRIAGVPARPGPAAVGPAASRPLRRWFWRLREIPAIPVDCSILLWRRAKARR